MKKLEKILVYAMWVELAVGALSILQRCIDYCIDPMGYAMQSAPWYLSCIVDLILTAGIMLLTAIVYWIVRAINWKKGS